MPQPHHYNPSWVARLPMAHRGLHGPGAPENSLAAFRAAVQAGYAIELDIHLVDGRLLVAHDAPDPTVAARLPLLADVLAVVGGRVPIDIEIKWPADMSRLGPALIKLLAGYKGEIVVTSFDPRQLIWLRRHAAHIPRGQLASLLPQKPWPRLARFALRSMPLNWLVRPAFVAYDQRDYPTRSLQFWRRILRIPVVLCTIENTSQLAAARTTGCNIIFDHVRP